MRKHDQIDDKGYGRSAFSVVHLSHEAGARSLVARVEDGSRYTTPLSLFGGETLLLADNYRMLSKLRLSRAARAKLTSIHAMAEYADGAPRPEIGVAARRRSDRVGMHGIWARMVFDRADTQLEEHTVRRAEQWQPDI